VVETHLKDRISIILDDHMTLEWNNRTRYLQVCEETEMGILHHRDLTRFEEIVFDQLAEEFGRR
jgi:hypothetical protein